MQASGVIEPSESPWASPVALVRKKDGTLRFCVDYRALNSVTKPDLLPLPRISDLLDQLGKCEYFTTLDLKSGYWQIKVHADSQEKTAFITHQGLFEFKVMPFGVTNAPAVFQRLMQRVPLHALTRKGTLLQWTANCEVAFETLKTRLVTAPLLCYPDFDKDFVLETDASKQGLGAILSQYQIDHKLHPVAYASCSISSTESNYAITDLETLAVVWAVTHFHYYLYGHKVTIITDHATVKAILGAPS